MKNTLVSKSLSGLLLLLSVACDRAATEEPVFPTVGHGIEFRSEILPATRTVTEGRKTAFVEADRIGIFEVVRDGGDLLAQNAPYTLTEGRWTSSAALAFPVDGRAVNFYAYYPYAPQAEGPVFAHTVASDQSEEGAYDASDLLLASHTEAVGSESEILFRFRHALALAEATIAGTPETDPIAGVAIRARRSVTVDLQHGTATADPNAATELVTMHRLPDGRFRAVIPAQQVHAGNMLRITTRSGRTYWYRSDAPTEFAAGRISAFTIDCGE